MVELTDFDPNEFEPIGSFEPLPAGDYIVVIESSESKKASTGDNNRYLQFVYNVVDGEYKGRKVFDRLNVKNDSEQAEAIAKRSLASICMAVGVYHPTDTEELHDKPFMVTLGIRPAKGEFGPSNVVKGYKMKDGGKIGGSAPTPSSPEKHGDKTENGGDTTAKKKMPWSKGK